MLDGSADVRKTSCTCETEKWIYEVCTGTEVKSHTKPLFLVNQIWLKLLIEKTLRAKCSTPPSELKTIRRCSRFYIEWCAISKKNQPNY